jgi:hypothetical protein
MSTGPSQKSRDGTMSEDKIATFAMWAALMIAALMIAIVLLYF